MPGKKKPGPSVKDPEVYEEIREKTWTIGGDHR
jgi:hypothetical protein